MKNLNEKFYSLVFCKKSNVKPWILFENYLEQIQETANFLDKNNKKIQNINPDSFLDTLELLKLDEIKEKKEYSSDEITSLIGLRSHNYFTNTFRTKEDFLKQYQSSDNILPTEKFPSSIATSVGSGRHALTHNLQFKGIGTNNLSTQLDFSHSWGGYLPIDGLKALIADEICAKRSKMPALKTVGLFMYDDTELPSKQILALRENNDYRTSTFWRDIINDQLRKIGREHLERIHNSDKQDDLNNLIFDNYIQAYSNGVIHRTPVADNLTISGKWIDTESIDFSIEAKKLETYFFIFIKDKVENDIQTFSDIKDLHKDIYITGSSVHDLMMPCYITHKCLDNIFKNQSEDFFELFHDQSSALSLTSTEKEITKHQCLKLLSLKHESYSHLTPYKYEDLEEFANFKCFGNFYDIRYGGSLLYFAKSNDISSQSKQMLEKWNLAITKNKLDWENSLKRGKLIATIS